MSEPSEQSMERSREVVRKEGDRAFSIKGIHPTLGEMWSTSPAKPDWVEQVQTALAALLDAAIEGERERIGPAVMGIIRDALGVTERKYKTEDGYTRWGLVEKDIAAAIRGEQ